MTGGIDWQQSAPELAGMSDRLDIGLHLTLTELPPLGPMRRLVDSGVLPDINTLICHTLLRRLDPVEVRSEARRQIDAFCRYLGRTPDHIDGHQHVHCFPVIRTVIYELATEYGCYVRNCATELSVIRRGAAAWAKAAVINIMGYGFNAGLEARNIPHNRQFFGLHDFDPLQDTHAMYAAWLRTAAAGALINCHPGDGAAPGDALALWRKHEFDYLRGDAFATLLRETGTTIARFRPPATPAG